jgi:uncharacterized protein (TIGR03382 family)
MPPPGSSTVSVVTASTPITPGASTMPMMALSLGGLLRADAHRLQAMT